MFHDKFYEVGGRKSELLQLHDNKQGMFTVDALAPRFTRASNIPLVAYWLNSKGTQGLCVFSLPISRVMIRRIYTLSYHHHHQIGSMNYYPLVRVRSWNKGERCMSLYILMWSMRSIKIVLESIPLCPNLLNYLANFESVAPFTNMI